MHKNAACNQINNTVNKNKLLMILAVFKTGIKG